MKRAEGLLVADASRRQVCGAFAACVGLAIASCNDGEGTVIGTGILNGPDGTNQNNPDGGSNQPPVDAMGSNTPDAGVAATCPSSGATDVGAPSSFVAGTPKYFSSGNFFVMRDSGGLYALTARCTHQGVTVQDTGNEFYCPAHGATFDYNGTVTGGPTSTSLVHYEMCTLSNGHVGVVKSVTVSKTQRLVA